MSELPPVPVPSRSDPRFLEVGDSFARGRACAKLNLFLEVTGRRPDGYHEIESVMHEVRLADEVDVRWRGSAGGRPEDEVSVSGRPLIVPAPDNLVLKAVREVRRHASVPAVSIQLHKEIPCGAGLGGGSSDAAFVLKALALLLAERFPIGQLDGIARNVGADVPFFLRGGSAVCRGIGDLVTPLSCIPNLWFVLAVPAFSLSTARVYAQLRLTAHKQDVMSFLSSVQRWHEEGGMSSFNRLETAAFEVEPRLRLLRDQLVRVAHSPWFLTGSGSVLFAAFGEESVARGVAAETGRRCEVETLVTGSFPT